MTIVRLSPGQRQLTPNAFLKLRAEQIVGFQPTLFPRAPARRVRVAGIPFLRVVVTGEIERRVSEGRKILGPACQAPAC